MNKTESRYLVGETWKFYEAYLDQRKPAKVLYLRHFPKFLEWINMDTDKLYRKVIEDLRSDEPMRRMWLGKKVLEFQEYMRDELGYRTESGMATRTVRFPYHAVVAFFKSLGIKNIPMESQIEIESEEIPIIYAPQLRQLVEATGSFRNKALICFLKDSGLRSGDVGKVTTKMIRRAAHLKGYGVDPLKSEEVDFCTFTITQEKTKRKADPVIGPETLKWLRKWNEWKKKNGFPTGDSDPLFCTIKIQKGYFKGGNEISPSERGSPLDSRTIGNIFHSILVKVGLDKDEEGNPTKISTHSCRKFTQTMLEHAKVPTNWINKMTGRKGIGTSGIYSKPNTAELIEHYSGAYDKLCIFEDMRGLAKMETLGLELSDTRDMLSEVLISDRESRQLIEKQAQEIVKLQAERDKYRAGYEERARLQSIVDKARLDGDLPEELIKKLKEKLENVETFEEGVTLFHKLKEEIELEEERSENWDFKMVDDEAEMILNARDGWEIFKELNDGKYLLRKHL